MHKDVKDIYMMLSTLTTGTVGVINNLNQSLKQTLTCTLIMTPKLCSVDKMKFGPVKNGGIDSHTDSKTGCTYVSLTCLPSGKNQKNCQLNNPDRIYNVVSVNGNSCSFD